MGLKDIYKLSDQLESVVEKHIPSFIPKRVENVEERISLISSHLVSRWI